MNVKNFLLNGNLMQVDSNFRPKPWVTADDAGQHLAGVPINIQLP
jgi:hypothetical protein